jgi:hypothetical protein
MYRPGKPCVKDHPKIKSHIGFPSNCTGLVLCMYLAALTKSTSVLFETWKSSSPVVGARAYRDGSSGNRREAMDCETWPQEPCHPHTALARRSQRVWVCRSHTFWIAQGRVHPGPHQLTWHDVWKCLTGRTFGTFGVQRMIWFWPGKVGSLGMLACEGGPWPKRCHTMLKALATSRQTIPVSRPSSECLFTVSKRWASCSVVVCMGRNPDCSSHRSLRSFTS